jgi:hypothetical protein
MSISECRSQANLSLARYGQKTVPFQALIDHSAVEKERLENMTMYCLENLALANAALGRVTVA